MEDKWAKLGKKGIEEMAMWFYKSENIITNIHAVQGLSMNSDTT